MSIKKHIPNFFTALNLLSGSIAVPFIFSQRLSLSAWLICLAAVFDFIDGFAARLLKATNSIGKELDSLADMVSFGLVPGLILYMLIQTPLKTLPVDEGLRLILPYSGLLIPVFSALRLAKFNTDDRQIHEFIGLPTPANAILIASFPLMLSSPAIITGFKLQGVISLLQNPYFLTFLSLVLSWLLVSGLRLMSLKFKTYTWRENKARYLLLILSLLLLVLFHYFAVPLIILLYLFLSLFKMKSASSPV
jgi:CDP-diacylglycerol--serine O-phosphatidyltransferase